MKKISIGNTLRIKGSDFKGTVTNIEKDYMGEDTQCYITVKKMLRGNSFISVTLPESEFKKVKTGEA
jgi:hypothetical protein